MPERLQKSLEKIRLAEKGGLILIETPEAQKALREHYDFLQEQLKEKQIALSRDNGGPKMLAGWDLGETQRIRKQINELRSYLMKAA